MRSNRSRRLCIASCLAAFISKPLRRKRMSAKPSNAGVVSWVPQVSLLRAGLYLFFVCPFVLLTACRPHDFPQYDANHREYAYVTNGGSGTVSVYDVVNVRVDRE